MNKLAIALAVLAVPIQAATVTIDGRTVRGVTIQSIVIVTNAGAIIPTPAPVPVPTPTPVPDGCNVLGVVTGPAINFTGSNPKTFIRLNASRVVSSRFRTTKNSAYAGQLYWASVTGGTAYQKRMWISECPGGPSLLAGTRRAGFCDTVGGEYKALNWTQKQTVWSCGLELDTVYFVNYSSPACTSSRYCNVNRGMNTNGKS